jgi:hypothetical protein
MPNTMSSNFKPANNSVDIVTGNTWSETFALTLDTVPIILTGSTILVSIYKGCSTNAALWTATNGDGVTITGAGFNEISLSKIVTLAKGDYIWDLKVTYLDGKVKTYVWGDFIIYENINQA